ncbi:hypothetical protein IGI39_004411 [Enterococcus sp. AZ135]|uniref:hypothetical protein n=1 Tax=unclassified Enterococcus TaxID=2608891 RepID=UPI003F29CFED
MKKIWAVMCGAIREELEVRLTMNKLLEMREANVLEGIIVSTWTGEFERYSELKRQLEENHVIVIEQSPLEKRVSIAKTNSVNYLRQAMQLQAALDYLPNDCFILKVRSDRALTHIKQIEPYLAKTPTKVPPVYSYEGVSKDVPKIFDYKLIVFNAKTQRLFNFIDFVFLGYASDIRKLLNFDIAELYVDRDLVANTQWFVYPFLREFPIIRDYFRLINFRPLIAGMKDYFEHEEAEDYFPTFFYRVYGTYLMILAHYFQLVEIGSNSEDVSYHFSDLFIDAKEKGIAYTQLGSVLQNDTVVRNFLNPTHCYGKESDTKFSNVLRSKQLFQSVSNQEFEELRDFKKSNGWNLPKNWLREKRWKTKIDLAQTTSYQKNILAYPFAGLSHTENQSLLDTLKDQDHIDRYLYNYWLNSPSLGQLSAEQMILPLARTQDQNALLIVSRMLRLNKFEDKKICESLSHLIEVSFDVRIQRKTVNIKTCQFMLNLILSTYSSENKFSEFYLDGRVRFILDRYLERTELEKLMKESFTRPDLVAYLVHLAKKYREKDRKVRELRLMELAMEIELDASSFETLLNEYTERNDDNNARITEKSLTLFE